MQDMAELILLYDLVVSRADPSDNPCLDELKSREVRIKQKNNCLAALTVKTKTLDKMQNLKYNYNNLKHPT